MALDPALLAVLACPQDKGPLYYLADEHVLYNPRLGRTYPIRQDIPVLLVEEATSLDDSDRTRIEQRIEELDIAPTFEG